jgi:hypothetical protein
VYAHLDIVTLSKRAPFPPYISGTGEQIRNLGLAARLTRPDCPPAEGLSDDMRRQLEKRALQGDAPGPAEAAGPANRS